MTLDNNGFLPNFSRVSDFVTRNITGCLDRKPLILRGFLFNYHLLILTDFWFNWIEVHFQTN